MRVARKALALTQVQLAARAGCNPRSVWAAELGQGHAGIYLRLAACCGMELAGRSLPPGDSLGARLHILRKRMRQSRRELAILSSVSQAAIADIEANRPGHLAILERLADGLGAGLTLVPAGQAASFFSMAAISSGVVDWASPPEILAKLYTVIGGGFDLDPCAAVRGRSKVRARVHYDADDDGLVHPWPGRVYMNPPYGRSIGQWTAKAAFEVASGRASLVVGLVPVRSDTQWWHASIAGQADAWLLKGRLSFGSGQNPAPFASALILWGATPVHRARMSQAFADAWHVPAAYTAAAADEWRLAAD